MAVRLSERTQLLVIHMVLTDGRPLILDMPVIGPLVDTSAMDSVLADNPA